MGNSFYRYRFPEIIQVFGISVSLFFFTLSLPAPSVFLLWSLSILAAIASAFWLNDYCDFEDDLNNPRKIRHHSKRALLVAATIALGVSLVSAIAISQGLFLTVVVTGIISVLYSVPLIRLKSRIFLPFTLHLLMGIIFFQSGAHAIEIHNSTEICLMAIFWGLILASGSLGNELVDQDVDRKMNIATIANTYPARARLFMITVLATSFVVLLANMILMELSFSLLVSIFFAAIVMFSKRTSLNASEFRKMYRIIFVTIIVIFHLEIAYRG